MEVKPLIGITYELDIPAYKYFFSICNFKETFI